MVGIDMGITYVYTYFKEEYNYAGNQNSYIHG